MLTTRGTCISVHPVHGRSTGNAGVKNAGPKCTAGKCGADLAFPENVVCVLSNLNYGANQRFDAHNSLSQMFSFKKSHR